MKFIIGKEILLKNIVFTPLIMSSCVSNEKIDRTGLNEYTFEEKEDKIFQIDETISQATSYIQIKDDLMLFYNKPGHNICVFDIPSTKMVKKIQLHKEGPNHVYGIQGFYYETNDSIWLYNSWLSTFVLVDSLGYVNSKFVLDENKSIDTQYYSASPMPLTDMPIEKIKNTFILQGMNGPSVETGNIPAATVMYNIESDSYSIVNPYPDVYGDGREINKKWDTFSYRAVPYTIGQEDIIVSSFPADDNIQIYDNNEKSYKKYFAGYSEKTNIKPSNGNTIDSYLKDYLEQYQYAGIFYDKYNNLYYRIVLLPLSEYDIKDRSTQYKNLSIVILDSSFNKVGEHNLKYQKYVYRNTFVSTEGLHINIVSEDDDYFKFITLKPKKIL